MAMGPSFCALQVFYTNVSCKPKSRHQPHGCCSTMEIWMSPVRETALIILLFSNFYVWKVSEKQKEAEG